MRNCALTGMEELGTALVNLDPGEQCEVLLSCSRCGRGRIVEVGRIVVYIFFLIQKDRRSVANWVLAAVLFQRVCIVPMWCGIAHSFFPVLFDCRRSPFWCVLNCRGYSMSHYWQQCWMPPDMWNNVCLWGSNLVHNVCLFGMPFLIQVT